MIRSESEYRTAVDRLRVEADRLRTKESQLKVEGYSREEIKRLLDPERSFREQLREEVESYERLCRGEFEEISNFEGIGRLLIALRIASGLSQRELAQKLNVNESQVSRDERNEYHGITVNRVMNLLKAVGAELQTTVVSAPSKRSVAE